MNICLIGSLSINQYDEGMRNVLHHITKELSLRHQILCLNAYHSSKFHFWKSLKSFKPDIIHYIGGPTLRTLAFLEAIRKIYPTSNSVISALHPYFPKKSEIFVHFFRHHFVICSSQKAKRFFDVHGYRSILIPNGVDLIKFRPFNNHELIELRKKFNIRIKSYIILHIGSIKEDRGLKLLSKLQKEDQQVLVVGSHSTGYQGKTLRMLENSGCLVWRRYFPNIEQIYGLADCYIFPTRNPKNAIEMPLSVLEAMACNMPVLSYPFGGLPDFFLSGDGLEYFQNPEEMEITLHKIRQIEQVKTRDKLIGYDWEHIATKIESVYSFIAH